MSVFRASLALVLRYGSPVYRSDPIRRAGRIRSLTWNRPASGLEGKAYAQTGFRAIALMGLGLAASTAVRRG